ncbi:MAG: ABC transporter substrate-binding protein [Opitutus sp.]|nr:ABC transporter substrate-binding protein [Opitutus sp.]MCS6248275.1 ABC transporter substrate-binding protein [Opitutus sp.]MCS6274964.1 ABC transporter substrate-binding protein [Opitutus sp.]MCS6279014.1 ABC transporter substrate-binding protein [Opitutus sp.]MCS6298763.1 ABC transporter substrate-binding protein [Opitutus sp.]
MNLPTRLLLLPALLLGLSSPLRADIIEVRADNWMPYNGDPAAERPGYVVELLRAAFPNDTINYKTCPWAQACAELAEGKIDAILGAGPSDSPGAILPELTIGAMRNIFYVKKGTAWRFKGIESLKSIRLAAASGYAYDNDGPLDTYLKQGTAPAVQFGTGDAPLESTIGNLRNGAVDAAVEDASVMLWTLKQLRVPTGEIHSAGALAKEGSPLHVAFTAKKPVSTARAEQLTATVRKMRESGALTQLLALYDLDDWKR